MPRPKNKPWNEFPPAFLRLLQRFETLHSDLTLTYENRSKAETARSDLYHFFRVMQASAQPGSTAAHYNSVARRLVLSVQGTSPAKLVISWREPTADRLAAALQEKQP